MDYTSGFALWLLVGSANGDQWEMRGREGNEMGALIPFVPLVPSILSRCRLAVTLYLGP